MTPGEQPKDPDTQRSFPFAPPRTTAPPPPPPPPAPTPGGIHEQPTARLTPGAVYTPPQEPPPDNYYAQQEGVPEGRILYEEVTPAGDRRKFYLLLAGVCAGLCLLGGVIAYGLAREFMHQKEKEGRIGLLGLAMYGQTQQRLQLLSMVANRYYDRTGKPPTAPKQLIQEGADPGLLYDKWGTSIRMAGGRLTSAGQDKKFNTEDDVWVEMLSGEIGGYSPSAEEVLKNNPAMRPEARTIFNQIDRIDKIARDKEETMSEGMYEQRDALTREAEAEQGLDSTSSSSGPSLDEIDVTEHRGKEE